MASESTAPPISTTDKCNLVPRWYYGGLAGASACCLTHPIDLLKVLMQTQQTGKKTLSQMARRVLHTDGPLGFYNGLSASILRQLTYSTVRFGIYEHYKSSLPEGYDMPLYERVAIASFSGCVGGFVGTPGDLVNVRMQNDVKLPLKKRRNYKHAIDGLIRIAREEGLARIFRGSSMASTRAVFVAAGDLAFYDQIKETLFAHHIGSDNLKTHLLAGVMAATISAFFCQPLDVLKTRLMYAKPGQFKGIADVFWYTAKLGPRGFAKGFLAAWMRILPHTVLTFIFLEQMRINFGVRRDES